MNKKMTNSELFKELASRMAVDTFEDAEIKNYILDFVPRKTYMMRQGTRLYGMKIRHISQLVDEYSAPIYYKRFITENADGVTYDDIVEFFVGLDDEKTNYKVVNICGIPASNRAILRLSNGATLELLNVKF